MNKIAKALFVMTFVLFLIDAYSFTCMSQTLEEQIDRADIIVSVVLIEAKIIDDDFRMISAKFNINEILKGRIAEPLAVTTCADFGTGSDIPLTMGAHYILFTRYDSLAIDSCSGSTWHSQERIEELKKILNDE